jgi:hypothetical protein
VLDCSYSGLEFSTQQAPAQIQSSGGCINSLLHFNSEQLGINLLRTYDTLIQKIKNVNLKKFCILKIRWHVTSENMMLEIHHDKGETKATITATTLDCSHNV